MEYRFKIKGIIVPESYGWMGEFDPTMLDEHLTLADGQDLFIDIDSVGGCVTSGLSMYVSLRRYADEHQAKITTRTSGFVASIATAVFLAGERRIVNEFMQPFIHEPYYEWTESQTSDDFKKDYQELEKSKQLIAEFYSKTTNLSVEDALEIMANDTWMSAEECLAVGFATEIEELSQSGMKIAAKLKSKYNNKATKMSKKSESKMAWYERLANTLKGDTPKAELELASVDEKTIVFPTLEATDTPTVGIPIVVDDDAKYTGEVETDEFVITVEDGMTTAVFDKTEINEEEVIEELLAKVETLTEALAKANAKKDEYAKLYNSIGSKKEAPKSGKETKAEAKDEDPVATAVSNIKERLKNKK